MSEEKKEIKVFETPVFKRTFKRLTEKEKEFVDDQIDLIIDNPELGEKKKGDLSYLRVHKFMMNNRQVLLGYSWQKDRLELYLLNIGPHENFYRDLSKRRKTDLDFMK